MLTQLELKAVRKNLSKIQQEPSNRTEKLSDLLQNVSELARLTPYLQTQTDLATKGEMSQLEKEVRSAHRASLIRTGETSEYSRYKANAALGGIDGHPDARHNMYSEIKAQLRKSPELRLLASGLAGLTKEQLKGDLPA